MAKKKVTITIDSDRLAAIEEIAGKGQVSGWIDEAVKAKLEQAERAQRAIDWFAGRARTEHPGQWDTALEAVREADARRGYPAAQGQSAA
ncbi:hypothetical protein ABT009_34995 [Streptomyces sp. NPDC002896]|jgi:hypothetical protein|uniref:CopG family transcriptional regulator n=1 Tax=Streptomyces himalayensis subsp. aureolus TaxID=2758039 RepID=A0A7W2HED7_9ACTN|nr:hypothetical protein [Streptomyces himalayensis]MBA4860762.1 hypothetical protein [Streptomyces himalayensis subsp. aureolus]